jgi:hypothetical protein
MDFMHELMHNSKRRIMNEYNEDQSQAQNKDYFKINFIGWTTFMMPYQRNKT